MSIWEEFVSTENIEKIKRKNKKVLFYKKIDFLTELNLQEEKEELSQDLFKVNTFCKKDKRNFKEEAILDLHGYTVDQAMTLVQDFFFENDKKNIRNLLIITGGSEKINKAIRVNFIEKIHNEFSPLVSVISTASKKKGATGAFFVKLRQNFNNKKR